MEYLCQRQHDTQEKFNYIFLIIKNLLVKEFMTNNIQIEQQTKLSIKKRKILGNFFNRQNLTIQNAIFKENKNQFFILKSKFGINETTALSAFFCAINIFYEKEQLLKNKNKSQDLSTLASISDFSIKKFKKNKFKEKREKLLNIWSVVQKLKAENLSYREISDYLRRTHRMDISHTYIRNLYQEIQHD